MKCSVVAIALISLLCLFGCGEAEKVKDLKYFSPIGRFTFDDYQIIVKPDQAYDLCHHGQCVTGPYIPVGDGGKTVKLINFYNNQFGLDLEKLAVDNGYMDYQLDMAIENRKTGNQPNDLVFSVSNYCETPCFFLGDYYPDGLFFKLDPN